MQWLKTGKETGKIQYVQSNRAWIRRGRDREALNATACACSLLERLLGWSQGPPAMPMLAYLKPLDMSSCNTAEGEVRWIAVCCWWNYWRQVSTNDCASVEPATENNTPLNDENEVRRGMIPCRTRSWLWKCKYIVEMSMWLECLKF